MEQVSNFGDTLPKLSAGGSDAEIAALGVGACHRAAEVARVLYLAYHPSKGCCEVVVDQRSDGTAIGGLELMLPVEGFLAELLADGRTIPRDVAASQRLGTPGSVEHLAERQILGVPVTYGTGDKPVTLGVLLLLDKLSTYGRSDGVRIDNQDVELAQSFAAMLGAVLGARRMAAAGKELAMAQTIQQQILPERAVQLRSFDVAATYFACGAVGGDYFDYVPLADGRTLAVVADVSGHNLASGMIMVSARAMLRTLCGLHTEPKQVFDALAARMYEDLTRTERFLTAAAVALRPGDGRVDYLSAGHNDLLVWRRATDRVERIASDSIILGFLREPDYTQQSLQLAPGDCLLLYTDGITEAMNAESEMFGDDRLASVFAQLAPNRSAQRIVDGLVEALEQFRRGQIGTDDVTAVVVRYTGGGAEGGTR
jgi:serine phosphatase RsbU (regulator of sigma subunit)